MQAEDQKRRCATIARSQARASPGSTELQSVRNAAEERKDSERHQSDQTSRDREQEQEEGPDQNPGEHEWQIGTAAARCNPSPARPVELRMISGRAVITLCLRFAPKEENA